MIEAPPLPAAPPGKRASPYQGLKPFSEVDADFFFGRDTERQVIASNLIASRLTVVYGPSGVGKSSLLRAGVAHDLREISRLALPEGRPPDFIAAVFPGLSGQGPAGWQDPPIPGILNAVEASIRDLLGDRTPELPRSPGLSETLLHWSEAVDAELLIVLDQFEEYFQYHGDEGGEGTFDLEFPRALQRSDLRANFLISIREDALAQLDRFKGRIRNLFGNYLRIRRLSEEAARSSIEGPIERYNRSLPDEDAIGIEPQLVDEVLRQVSAGRVVAWAPGAGATSTMADGDNSGIETPYLQLVMFRLWQEESGAGSRTLRLQTLRDLGGADRIVRDHLDHALDALTPAQRAAAAAAFRFLVTPSGAKVAHSLPDLAEFTEVPEAELAPVLEYLSEGETRILSEVGPAPGGPEVPRYEIFHDVLGPAIRGWRVRYEAEVRLEREKEESRARTRKARRRIRRLSVLAVAAVVFAALVSVLAVWALRQKDEAESQERAADAQALVAQAVTELDSDPQESLRLALEAWETNASDGALAAIRRALSESKVRAVMTGHTDIVWSSSFSPDGTKVVTASRDTTAIVWDAVTGDRLLTLGDDPETEEVEGHTDQVNSAVFTPDGTRIVTVSYDGTARVWDATTGEASLVLPHDGEAVFLTTTEQFGPDGAPLGPVAFSPDGGRLVTYTGAGTVRVWDVASGQLLSLLGGPIAYSAAFSSDGTRIVTAHDGSVARIWDAANGTVEHRLDNQAFWSWGAAFSPDGSLVAVGNNDGTTGLFAVATGELERWLGAVGKVEFGTGHPGPVQGIAFSPDGRLLLTFGDKSARVWEVKSGRQIAVIGGASYVDMAAFSPDGGYVVTANQDATARVSEARTGQELMVLRGHGSIVWTARFSSDGNSVVTASEDGTARVWSVDTGLELRGHVRPVLAVGFSPNGDRVVTSSFDETARIWDSKSGEEQAVLVEAPSSVGYTNTMWSASWHRDGVRAVTAEDFGTVRIWRTNEEPATFEDCCDNQGWPAEWAEFSASGDRVLVVYGEAPFQTARIWELDGQGQWVEVHVFDEGNVSAATFSPDGSAILTADRDLKEAQLWDATTFESIRTIDTGLIVYVDFSPDGQRVVTAGTDRIVRVWNIDTGELVHELPTPAAVATVAYSPDGRWIVAGGSDGATRVWDAETGQILAVLRMHADSVASVDVGVDGRILSGSDDRTAKIYGCSTCVSDEDLIEQAREQAAIGT